MRIAMLCYPSVGGSGIVATELAGQLVRRGHEVHIITSDPPFRLGEVDPRVIFHQVETPYYPLFKHPPYVLALANRVVAVARTAAFDIIHAHYAVPHATAAYLAREMLGPGGPRVITTLHGTDITLLGDEPSFADIIAFSINQSDAVTAVSRHLAEETQRKLAVTQPVLHVPNFLDTELHSRQVNPALRSQLVRPGEKVLVHLSNFRRVKRVQVVVEVFARVAAQMPARLVLIGDGPDAIAVRQQVAALGLSHQVSMLGNQERVIPLLSVGDVFLLPSATESFGLAALEAMAVGVPVVASRVGGLPEVVVDGECGYLCAPDDTAALTQRVLALLTDQRLHQRMALAAAQRVREHFAARLVVPQYEAIYQQVLAAAGRA